MSVSTAPAVSGPMSAAALAQQQPAKQYRDQKPIPLPVLREGERCFRSRARAYNITVLDERDTIIDGHFVAGKKQHAQFRNRGWFGELVTSDPKTIDVIVNSQDFANGFIWDAVVEEPAYLAKRKAAILAELQSDPALLGEVAKAGEENGLFLLEAMKSEKKGK